MTTQLGAVMNRRIKPRYVDIINAQTPYLPYAYEQEQEQGYRDRMYGLEQDRLAQSKELAERQLAQQETSALRSYDLAKRAQEEQERQAKKARKLGYMGLGIQGLTGLANVYSAFKPTEAVAEETAPIVSEILPSAIPGIGEMMPEDPTGAMSIVGNMPSTSGLTDLANLVPEPIRAVGSGLWDFGTSIYDSATDFLGDLFF